MGSVVLMGDPAVARVPVQECGEPLEAAGDAFVFSELKADDEPSRSRVRRGVLERLVAAQALLPPGFRLCWVEGHRDATLQKRYFDDYRRQLTVRDPGLTEDAAYLLASRYVSPPEIAPHVSGAAIDLTLCDESGVELDLGTPVNASPEESDGACYFDEPVGPRPRRHRTALSSALTAVGLVNYPTEWWHWSYGDRYWAMVSGAPYAIYGPVQTGR